MPGSGLVAAYRLHAAHCVEISKTVTDPTQKITLLQMAQIWLRLAEQADQVGDTAIIVAHEPQMSS